MISTQNSSKQISSKEQNILGPKLIPRKVEDYI